MCESAAITTIRETLTPQCSQGATPWIPETPLSTSENASVIDSYNAAINEIALLTPGVSREPLPFS